MSTTHGFNLIQEQIVQELNSTAQLFEHGQTGAQLLSLQNDDENKVFGIAFRTPPSDSTGLPHIMEHSVLGGSRKYPLKEPFVELLKGSLKTFLNAFTSPDKTIYPVASQNLQDFYNLVDVYLDAVLHPLITSHHLEQEGWHYELENLDDPLIYKGVVYNEMKGAYSSPDSLFVRLCRQSLFPDTIYSADSGGDPRVMPNLTYEQFKKFHETYYHPSNSYIYFYGDDDPTERLRLLNEYLKEFDRAEIDSQIALQPPFTEPKRFAYTYSVDEEVDVDSANGQVQDSAIASTTTSDAPKSNEHKSMLRINWLLPEINEPATSVALGILSYAILGTAASPLYKGLTDSGLGEDVIGSGMSMGLRQITFSVGLKGIDIKDAEQVEQLIMEQLAALATEGIEPEQIEAAINTIEFSLRENNTGSFPRGISVMLRSLSTWLYDQDPIIPLLYEAPLTTVKGRLKDDATYLQSLIQEYLLDNPHYTITTMEPEAGLAQREEAEEKERLAQIRAQFSQDELLAIIENTKELKALQARTDDPAVVAKLPRLTLDDLDKESKSIPIEISTLQEQPVFYHDLFTNGIIYLDLGFNLRLLPAELLPYVQLFGRTLIEMGTETEDFVKLSQRIGRKTGGIYPSTFLSTRPHRTNGENGTDSLDPTCAWFFLRGKCTPEQAPEMFAILSDLIRTVQLDNQERFRQIVLEAKARKESSLVPRGHGVVGTRLRSKFSVAGWVSEQMGGVDNLFFLRKLADDIDNDWPSVLEKLELIRSLLLNRDAMISNVTIDSSHWVKLQPQLNDFVAALPTKPATLHQWTPSSTPDHEGFTIPAKVNYVAKGTNLYQLGYQLHGSASVITHFLRTSWIWERVRVQGGAYGGYCQFNRRSGVLNYLSYRDPNLLGTLDVYDQTAQYLRELDLNEDELTKGIIGVIGSLDSYQLPDARGYTSMIRHLLGESDESRQQFREEVLSTTQADFSAFANVLEQVKQEGTVVVMGSQEVIAAANQERNGWLNIQKVI